MKNYIYMDNSATTPVKKEVLDEMLPYFSEKYGNPSSIYSLGGKSKNAVENARDKVAKVLGAKPNEIFFTAGGSESDNWAIKGIAYANKDKGNHIITTKIEHHGILHTCQYLERQGFKVTYLDVDKYGMVDLDELRESITDETILITIMFANNEIGTIQPIKEIGQIAKEKNIYFHTDAVQAIGHVKIDVDDLNIDLLSLSAHKFYGPKGIGALYIRQGVKIHSLIEGGAQERNRRAGTENVPGIVGLGKAIELAYENIDEHNEKLIKLRERLIKKVFENISHVRLNGHPEKRLPGNVSFCFEFIEGESLLLSLDMEGIAGSSGSACTSGSLDPSHVLLAIGLPHEIAHGSLRLSLGDFNTEEEVDYVVEKLVEIVQRLREMSPLYEKVKGEK
ncbi:cysteine desulfurase NifS [Anaerosalibacter bizertensis]|uniref:Cysteine desulfurase IscS n=1 Tax=Anaerosalibacter bizertensis TaxID=932217 RepID=A0A844FFP1_9FIRM|nr:cysteine desulfurase NifS [Anaerosalibacter bizertensis]MBV1820889.1 cysteine desulfurase NifS [Bacteroidales bacterium MSK.15.36]MCB5558420.1 cysteine desulfurase NifS [Anaerosalibacter bizertensis]MCG4564184.1 cysteine desulfurase NifS [Anaerosalibacter bizertensis]MCG4582143.1 cysteine desulfurase NifS [Anaerosalibacter bizertensis]MCG4585122.1 cysteine desulfurase NifS [Anaerosalibacter bizertensis]